MKTFIRNALIVFLGFMAFKPTYAQYCMGGGPTTTLDSVVMNVSLGGDVYDISHKGPCPSKTGVANYYGTDSVDVTRGSTYCLEVSFSYCGSYFLQYTGEAWIDWNADSIFQPSESIGSLSGMGPLTETFSFTVPSGAKVGEARLRVMLENYGTLPLDPCRSFSYGSVEDYKVRVHSTAPSCVKPRCLSVSQIGADSALVQWNAGGPNYSFEYGPTGFTPGSGTVGSSNSTLGGLKNLSPNTTYWVYVRSDCGGGNKSDWSLPVSFSTLCDNVSSFPYQSNFDAAPWVAGAPFNGGGDKMDPCWIRDLSGNYKWRVGTALTGLSTTGPSSGSGGVGNYLIAFSGGVKVGDSAKLETPAFTLDSLNDPYVAFKYFMYGSSMGELVLQADSGKGWSTLWSLSGDQQKSENDAWRDAQIDVSGYSSPTRFRFLAVVTTTGDESDIALDEFSVLEKPACLIPGFPEISSITDSSARVTWTSNETGFTIEYGKKGFKPGFGISVNVHGTDTILYNLTAFTDYDLYLKNDCSGSSNGYSSNAGPVSFSTQCTPSTFYSESFDGLKVGQLPDCFSAILGTSGFVNVESPSFFKAYSSPNLVQIYNFDNTQTTTALVSPQHINLDKDTMQLRFRGKVSANGMKFYVGTLRDPLSDSSLVILDTISPSDDQWHQYIIPLAGITKGHSYIAFVHPRNPIYSFVYLDDYNYEPVPKCTAPTSLDLINATSNSAMVYWTQGGKATWSQLDWGPLSQNQPTGARITIQNDTAMITGLGPGGTYKVWVRDSCNQNDQSPWFGPLEITTECQARPLPFTEDFQSWFPTCWKTYGKPQWKDLHDPRNGKIWASVQLNNQANASSYLKTPPISISGNAWVKFDYSHQFDKYASNQRLTVLYRELGVLKWDTLSTLADSLNYKTPPGRSPYEPSNFPKTFIGYLPASAIGKDIEVALWAQSSFGADLFVRNFEVSAAPQCAQPANISIDSIFADQVNMSWYSPSSPGQYYVEWGLRGFSQGSGNQWIGRDTVSNPMAVIKGLSPFTCYDIYLQSDCGNGSVSPLTKYQICTLISCPKPTNSHVRSSGSNSVTFEWDSGGSGQHNVALVMSGTTPKPGDIRFGVSSNFSTFTGLSSGTRYDFYVRDSCGPGDVSDWEGPLAFVTPCAALPLNYIEPFDGHWYTSNDLNCWDGSGATRNWMEDAASGSAKADLYLSNGSSYLLTGPVVEITKDALLRFKWSHLGSANSKDSLAVWVKDTASSSTWELVWARGGGNFDSQDGASNNNPGSFAEDTLALDSKFVGSAIQVRFQAWSDFGANVYLDDVIVEADPSVVSCPTPGPVSVNHTGANTATLDWSGGNGPWEVSYSKPPFDPSLAQKVIVSSKPTKISGLLSNTSYEVRIREICSAGDTSVFSTTSSFRTLCTNSYSLPYQEDFGSWLKPDQLSCWDNSGGARTWENQMNLSAVATLWDWKSGEDGRMTSSVVHISSIARLRFKWSHTYDLANPNDSLIIRVRDTTSGSSWINLWQAGGANLDSKDGGSKYTPGTFREDTVTIPSGLIGSYVHIQIRAVSDKGGSLFIDQMNVESMPGCGTLGGLKASDVGCDSVQVSWTPVPGKVYGWIEYGTSGFTSGNGTLVKNPSNPFVIKGLNPGSGYDLYVQDSCSLGRSSREMISVTTLLGPKPEIHYTTSQSVTTSQVTVTFDANGSVNGTDFSWDFGSGNVKKGKTVNQVFTVNGNQNVTLTVRNGCGVVDSTFSLTIANIGIQESVIGSSWTIYPNPNNGQFDLQFEMDEPLSVVVRVIDFLGRDILVRDIGTVRNEVKMPIDLGSVPQGIYIIRLETEKGTFAKRISIHD